MKAVGIKQLKSHLSEYIRLAKAGETVLVTEREEVVAELRPAHPQPRRQTTIDDILEALAETGEVQRAIQSRRGWRWRPRGLGMSAQTARAILDAVREDRCWKPRSTSAFDLQRSDSWHPVVAFRSRGSGDRRHA